MPDRTEEFAILDADLPEDRSRWIRLWESWPAREVYAHPDYVSLFREPSSRVLAAIIELDNGGVLYPFLLRDLSAAPFLASAGIEARDVTTPYGYGGAFYWGRIPRGEVAGQFWPAWTDWAVERKVVSEFIRFSLFEEDLLPYPGQRLERQSNLVRALDPSEEEIWRDFKHKVRKNVNRARREEVVVEPDLRGRGLDEFLRIYETTMDRRKAEQGYYFDRSFFETLRRSLEGHFVFFHALWNGSVVSSELALVSASTIYSFLGGTDPDAFHVRPNDLLKYEIIMWGRKNGKSRFVLGGGYRPDDGIYQYKKSFAPNGALAFHVGNRVLLPELCDDLVEARRLFENDQGRQWRPQQGFFPAYRS